MTDDRSERLRKRRKQSNRPSRRTDDADRGQASSRSTDGTDTTDRGTGQDDDQTGSVKEERTGTYMYLPDSQLKELKRRYNVLKAEYEFEFDEEFEKNRHFYPLVIQYGLDGLDGIDVSEVRDNLDRIG